jgi:hypothetical protein
MKHTPGPWMPECIGSAGAYDNPTDIFEITNGRRIVADCVADDDAHLIAAAPELYEALKRCLPLIVGEVPAIAIEAIAKAEGK